MQEVYNLDITFDDDKMGEANIDIQPLVTSAMANGDISQDDYGKRHRRKCIGKWLKSPVNALLEDSEIVIDNGTIKQEVALQLQNVMSGIVYLEIQWIPP